MSIASSLDRFQRRYPWAGFPIAVIYKFFDDFGAYLSALLTYYAFISLFPLLLLASTILGFVLRNNPGLQQELLNSGLRAFPVVGNQLDQPKHLGGGTKGLVIGILGSLYGGLGVAQATQYAMNTIWRVPRNSRPNPFKARGRSIVLLAVVGLTALATTYLSTLGQSGHPLRGVGITIGSVLINAAAFVFAFRFGTTRELSLRDVAPGAIGSAVGWQLLQSFGVLYVNHVVRHASSTNGVFAVVLGLLAFLYVAATIAVLCMEVNAVRVDHLYPRALLTPFTDNVQLTPGDRRAYTHAAKAERSKGFQEVDVRFDQPPPDD